MEKLYEENIILLVSTSETKALESQLDDEYEEIDSEKAEELLAELDLENMKESNIPPDKYQ